MYFILIGKENAKFYLLPNTTYTVGRKGCDLLILRDDSISRKHAVLSVNAGDDYYEVKITDSSSRYGTFINDKKLKGGTVLRDGDNVKFGMFDSVYRLQTVHIVNTTSGIKSENKAQLKTHMSTLGGVLVQYGAEKCNYVTVEELTLTVKVLSAIIAGVPIVNVKYWNDYVNCVKTHKPPPDVKEYIPKCSETVLNENISLEYKAERKHLFENKLFVFPKEIDRDKMASLITLAGGDSMSWEAHPLNEDQINSEEAKTHVVIQTSNINESIKEDSAFSNFIRRYEKAGNRTIPLQEIALAIINCSCEKDCNPKFNRKAFVFKPSTQVAVRSEAFLAMPTQSMDPNNELCCNLKSEIIIPQSCDDDLNTVSKTEIVENTVEIGTIEDNKDIEIKDSPPALKRESDSSHNERNTKRMKVNVSSITEQRDPASAKSLFTFNSTGVAPEDINSTFHQNNPFKRKRKVDPHSETNSSAKSAHRDDKSSSSSPSSGSSRSVINPFSNLFRSKTMTLTKNMSVTKITSAKTNEYVPEKNLNSLEIDLSTISAVDNDLEKSFNWISKSNIKPNISNCTNKSNNDIDPDMLLFINSFKNSIIVETEDMIVHRPMKKMITNESIVAFGINYKKFIKVQPLHPQTTIIPDSKYLSVVCSNNNGCEYVQDQVDDDMENMDNDPITQRPARRQYVF